MRGTARKNQADSRAASCGDFESRKELVVALVWAELTVEEVDCRVARDLKFLSSLIAGNHGQGRGFGVTDGNYVDPLGRDSERRRQRLGTLFRMGNHVTGQSIQSPVKDNVTSA